MGKEPLAYRMRPENLEDFFGQEDIVGKGKLLYNMIKADRISSVILYGPPGTGKTTLAKIIAKTTKSRFEMLNAVTSGVKDIKNVVEEAKKPMFNLSGSTVLFIDEIHRFNKAQQDALLPSVENGIIRLIGATTENPYFEVNKALISRSSVFMLKPLTEDNIKAVIRFTLENKNRGYGNIDIDLKNEALDFLARISNGDARVALNALELAVEINQKDKKHIIGINEIENCVMKKSINFDKTGDGHYDNISAFIKSMRGSDPDATVFYLARAIYAGEDPMFLARRIIICASEDVGMANPSALNLAVSAAKAVSIIGMPEARIILSQAAIMVAASPKSNSSYKAILEALDDVKNKNTGSIPMHLRNPVVGAMKNLGYGKNYEYAHDCENNIDKQYYLPSEMKDRVYYNPTNNGYEEKVRRYIDFRKKKRGDFK
ncbi:MAG: replication-associated recombination protein A [Clostridiales bacterium]